MSNIPKTVSFSGDLLEKMKESATPELLSAVKAKAQEKLDTPLYAVTERKWRAVSGNPHDYSSISTYWWPNPDTPDGLPYVRRDGYTTPAAEDPITYEAMAEKAFDLALAAYYLDNEEYGRAAEKTLYDWHLNPETYMNPHAEYSQAIPGISTGRGIGIIDFSMRTFIVFDATAILESLGYISAENLAALKKWYTEFTDWMLTSEKGIDEGLERNNHGTYYDLHMLASAIFLDRPSLAKKICQSAYEHRIKCEMEPSGAQPLELARTMALIYSLSNLRAYSIIANMAERVGYPEYWQTDEKFGDSAIKKAVDYLYPYYKNPEAFPYQEIRYEITHLPMARMLACLDAHFDGLGYGERASEIIAAHSTEIPVFMRHPLK